MVASKLRNCVIKGCGDEALDRAASAAVWLAINPLVHSALAVPAGTAMAERKPMVRTTSLVGRAETINRLQIPAQASGFADVVRDKEGDAVWEGDALNAIESGDRASRPAVNTGAAQGFRSGQDARVFRRWFEQIGLRPGVLLDATDTLRTPDGLTAVRSSMRHLAPIRAGHRVTAGRMHSLFKINATARRSPIVSNTASRQFTCKSMRDLRRWQRRLNLQKRSAAGHGN